MKNVLRVILDGAPQLRENVQRSPHLKGEKRMQRLHGTATTGDVV